MQAGKLRHYVTVEEYNQTGTGTRGQQTGDWETLYANVPAEIVNMTGRELEQARQVWATATDKITIRYHASITTKHRVSFDGQVFNIQSVNNDPQKRVTTLICGREAA